MFAQAHYRVASKVRKIIEAETGYQLHPLFVYGNIKPDFTWKGMRQKHYLAEMLPVIIGEIENMKERDAYEVKKRKRDVMLGEICHFVTDFFTLPHNQRWEFKHSFRPHVTYEREVNRASKKGWDSPEYEKISNDVERWLSKRLSEYEGNGTPYKDLVFAEKACVEIVCHLVQEFEKKEWRSV